MYTLNDKWNKIAYWTTMLKLIPLIKYFKLENEGIMKIEIQLVIHLI